MGQGRRGGGDRLPGGETEGGPGGEVAQVGRDGRRGRAVAQRGGHRGGGQDHAAADEGASKLLACAGQPAAERAGRASEASGGLIQGEALEVAEDDRRAEDVRQAVDGAVQGLGLLAVEQGLFGRWRCRLEPGVGHGVPLFALMPADDASPGLAGGAEGHAVEPGGEPVGIAEGRRLAGQDEEGGLECVLDEVMVIDELPADAQDHRAVARDQGGEGVLGSVISSRHEPLDELAVGERGGGAGLEERAELADDRGCCQAHHGCGLSSGTSIVM